MSESLSAYILENVDPKEYWAEQFDDIGNWISDNQNVICPFHGDTDASLSLCVDGKWNCYGCEAAGLPTKGGDIISYHCYANDCDKQKAAREIYHNHLRPTIRTAQVRGWHRKLLSTPIAIGYLKKRHIAPTVISRRRIGFDGSRIIIPVPDQFGICVNLRRYDPRPNRKAKMTNYTKDGEPRSYGSPALLYPFPNLHKAVKAREWLFITEGEFDALVLESLGLLAVTSTHGSGGWMPHFNRWFKGLKVCIVYDNDEAGHKSRLRIIQGIERYAKEIRVLDIPTRVGKDVSDWVTKSKGARRSSFWTRKLEALTPVHMGKIDDDPDEVIEVTLDESIDPGLFKRNVQVPALVVGRSAQPYRVPTKYRVTCSQKCEGCPLAKKGPDHVTKTFDPSSPEVLELIECGKVSKNRYLLGKCGIGGSKICQARVEELKVQNVHIAQVMPTLDQDRNQRNDVRNAYVVGKAPEPNREYRMNGVITAHPSTQQATPVFSSIKPTVDDIETFELTSEAKASLKVFRPTAGQGPFDKLKEIADWMSLNVTRIWGRTDLHILTDLVFHSLSSFTFGEEKVRGMLDVLVVGDTRTGKGRTVEGLNRYYGEASGIVSAENCTFAGVIGGADRIGNHWVINWGAIPLNNRRMVIVDEAQSMSVEEWGKMSRVRSEGIAEITKIRRERVAANTRIIWIANPREGTSLATFTNGVESIKSLIGADEDIARLDLAIAIARNEVEAQVINLDTHPKPDLTKYPPHLARKLMMWAWSRTDHQIKFTAGAEKVIRNKAMTLGEKYQSEIPLVQSENVRFKLAKIAAAIAARLFSTDRTGEKVVVTTKHVRAAVKVMVMCYDKESMSYDFHSEFSITSGTPIDLKKIEPIMKSCPGLRLACLRLNEITGSALADYIGDRDEAITYLNTLTEANAIRRCGLWHTKTENFTKWLKQQERDNAYARKKRG